MDNSFNYLNLNIKRDFVLNYGEYVSEIKYYGFLVQLFIVEGFYIEMYFNTQSAEIEDVKVISPTERRLNLYAQNVNISNVL